MKINLILIAACICATSQPASNAQPESTVQRPSVHNKRNHSIHKSGSADDPQTMERLSIQENQADSVPLDQPAKPKTPVANGGRSSKSPLKGIGRALKHTAHFIGFPVQTDKEFGPDAAVNADIPVEQW